MGGRRSSEPGGFAIDITRKRPARGLVQLVYVSAASQSLAATDLAALVAASRRNNMIAGLTGFLLHQGSSFYGVLEGEPRHVFARMEVVIIDPRHREVRVLREEPIAVRRFENWTFGDLPDVAVGPSNPMPSEAFILNLTRRLR